MVRLQTTSSWRRVLQAACAATLMFVPLGLRAEEPAAPWLDEPAFGVAPSKLLAAAEAFPVPAAAGVIELLEEHSYIYDESGRHSSRHRVIYRIVKAEALQKWATVLRTYDPWYETKPEIRARVITPDGTSHSLDDGSIVESPYGAAEPKLFSERRVLTGPLPAVVVGSVVELESVRSESVPLFDSGTVERLPLRRDLPIRKIRITIDAPASLSLHYLVRGMDGVEPRRVVRGKRVELSLDAGPSDALTELPVWAPPDVATYPYFAWSTGQTWGDVASRYAAIVNGQIGKPDLRSLVAEATKGAADPTAVVAALVARLHREVRYTGVEFRDANIVPREPAETLTRKYGDCKDKATLLVAMLRTAGLRANVALVAAGFDVDPDDQLPGLGPFNHAIVRIEDPPLWIDATDEFARPGVLGFGVEGRMCLVAGPGSALLVRLPRSGPDENRVETDREIVLAERGPARILQTTHAWGISERNQRQQFGGADAQKIRDGMSSMMKEFLRAKSDAELVISDPRDLSERFQTRVEFPDAAIASTGRESASAEISLKEMAGILKSLLPPRVPPSAARRSRTVDVVLPWAIVSTCRYRVHPPPGFAAAEPPGPIDESLGPATLRTASTVETDGTVTLEARLDTVRSRWTAAEADAAMAAVDKLNAREPLTFKFDQLGQKYLHEGHIQEALQEFRALVKLHPSEADHVAELAEALLAAGLGDAARDTAQRAVVLEPTNPMVYRSLGFVYLHDIIGRLGTKGSDLRSAEAAFRKCKDLAPSDPGVRGALATTLTLNENGVAFGPGARVDEAIAEYLSIQDELHSDMFADELLGALFRASRFDEVMQRAPKSPPSTVRDGYWIAALAASGPVDAAIAQATRLGASADSRRELLAISGAALASARHWPEAGAMLAEATRGASSDPSDQRLIDTIGKTKRIEDLALEGRALQTVAKFISALAADDAFAAVTKVSAAAPRRRFDDARIRRAQRMVFGSATSFEEDSPLQFPRPILPDLMASAAEWKADGSDAMGHRVRMRFPRLDPRVRLSFFTASAEDQSRVLALDFEPAVLGEEALLRLAKGDIAGAGQWLRWAADEIPIEGDHDTLSVPPFMLFWGDHPPTDAEHLKYAAAALVAQGDGAAAAVPILEEGAGKAKQQQEKFRFDRALEEAFYNLKDWDRLIPVARRVRQTLPDSEKAYYMEADALVQSGRWVDVDALIEEQTAKHPDAIATLDTRVRSAARRGRWDQVEELLRSKVKDGTADGWQLNEFAWAHVMRGKVTEETLAAAQRSAQPTEYPTPGELHTFGSVQAELGRGADARETMLKEMDARSVDDPEPNEWYVFGRIAEGYGELAAAETAYRRVTEAASDKVAEDCRTLARRRLAAIASPTEQPATSKAKTP